MRQIWLSNRFRTLWDGQDPFEQVDRLQGEVFRDMKSRKTMRVIIEGHPYFAKIHYGVGWLEIVKNLLKLKRPVLDAQDEWRALSFLTLAGVRTMTPVAFGRKGNNPARIRSFLITEELTGTTSLEALCAKWASQPPSFCFRRVLTEQLASMVRQMHRQGMNHRDCYLCHFHLDTSSRPARMEPGSLGLYVIDLHRAQIRRRTPRRWLVKDLAGLYCSAMDIGLTRADRLRFIKAYEQRSLRDIFRRRGRLWRRVERTAIALNKKLSRKQGRRLRAILHHT